ncbi:MAG: EamA family transporter [Cyanobacteria bacterium REEB459]|nr:EamA family transporter [Cyanobacteria bacterium REEB459]
MIKLDGLALIYMVAAMVSTQVGSALAKSLFVQVGPFGVVCLRVGLAALMLMAWQRPRLAGYSAKTYQLLVMFGLALAVMNSCFYGAIARIPIGVAVAVEFSGPLVVAMVHSRRWIDGLWVALAALGIGLLSPLHRSELDSGGLGLALLAGVAWGLYMLLSARVGQVFKGSQGLALAMTVGGLSLLPWGWVAAGPALLSPSILGLGLVVALLSSALPCSLEMAALRRISMHGFGVLLSLEPAIAATTGFLGLGETLTVQMIVAIGLIMIAAAGVALSQSVVVMPSE